MEHSENSLAGHFLVYVRVRPLTPTEISYKSFPQALFCSAPEFNEQITEAYLKKDEEGALIVNNTIRIDGSSITIMSPDKSFYDRRGKTYEFNGIFDPQSHNSYVFETSLKPHLGNFLEVICLRMARRATI